MLSRFSRILVVDGCAESRKTTHRFLHLLGYDNVDYASDGGPALKLLAQNQYRLVLADWDMAPIDGQHLLKAMRADQRSQRLPFIMAIARTQKKFSEIARDDGATLFLTRPFTADILAERIAQVNAFASELREVRLKTVQPSVPTASNVSLVPRLWQSLRT